MKNVSISSMTPRKNIVKYQSRIKPVVIKIDQEVKTVNNDTEMILVLYDDTLTNYTLDSISYNRIIIKSFIDVIIKPDVGVIDNEWDEVELNKGASLQLDFIDDVWYITSSDGLKKII